MTANYTGPEPEEIRIKLQEMADQIKKMVPRGWGFTLLLFDYYQEWGSIMYISTAEREAMKKTMRELLEKWEREERQNAC